ncbi:MAG TPA: GNAT family N-acetyltransferase [Dermatophilaceae bacterium]|nr:GNAT family N-acetyltransferase [Dermatophilaceae bacterium]
MTGDTGGVQSRPASGAAAPAGFELSTDPGRIQFDLVHAWLAGSYWAAGRTAETQARANAGSRVYGVYDGNGAQVAFARAVTDGATYAWLCDVVVTEHARGRGIGTWLVDRACGELEADGVRRILLATRDAHQVYRQLGFSELRHPETMMERDRRRR